jgi:RHS repeat-associated protein
LRLDKVQEFGSDGVASKSPYTFTYLNTGVYILPQQQSYAQDHWGFYNGADGNNTLLPEVLASASSLAQPGADRTPDREATKAGIIQQITYPTGGNTIFEFECHEFNGSDNIGEMLPRKLSTEPIAGGLRIKEIKSFDGTQTTYKKYTYKDFNNSALSSGVLLSPIAYTYNQTSYSTGPSGCFGPDLECNGFGQSSSSTIPLSMGQGSHVVYPQITEYLGQNGEFGKTEYTFTNPTDGYSINFYIPAITSYDWGRGMLTKKEDYVYMPNTNTYVKVQKTENTYNMRDTAGLVNNSQVDGLVIRYWKKPPCASSSSPAATFSTWFQWQAYSHISRWFYLKSSTTTSYDLAGASPVTSTSTTAYRSDGVHTFPVQTIVTNSNQVANISNVYYPQDITSTHPNYAIMSEFVNRYMIGVPLQTEQIIGTSKSGGILEFQKFGGNALMFYPYKYYSINRDGTTKTLKVTLEEYDNTTFKGMPTKVSTPGFAAADYYAWNNKKQLLSKTMKNTANNLWLTSSFTYKTATYLVESITDENGLLKKFGYDKFMRLETVRDRMKSDESDVQATTTYRYHYKGEAIPNNPTPDDVNRNFVGTISTFKGVTAPLSTKQYLDGLGRPMEVVKEFYTPPTASHSAYWHQKNYVSYDALGRQNRSYLPFETGTLGFENASIYLNAAGYVETAYEASPLSRPISQRNVDGTYTYMSYGTNTATDAVQIMVPVTTPLPVGVLVSASSPNVYGVNTLYKTTMTDENGKQTCVFKDKLGRVILTRKFLNGSSGQNVDTYNVYDDYGQLVVVVPPGALTISNTTATVVNDLTFQYKYDNKNRLVVKKIPGANPQKFYYDSRDLLVLTQDGNMYAESGAKHLATLYDDLGRVIKTGFTNIYYSLTEGTEVTITDSNITEKLTETQYYPNKMWVKHQGAKVLNSTNLTLPTNFLWSYTERRVGLEYTGNPVWQGKQHLRYSGVSQNPILDSDIYGVDWVVSGYNGMQQPDLTIRYLFEDPNQAGEVRTWQNFTYDNGRRLTDIKYNYGTGGAGISSPTNAPSLSNMNYNFKDQLIEKNIGFTGTSALQSIDYAYNLRGWLTNINNVALNNGSTMSIMTPNMTGSGTIQNLAITPFINRALAEAVKPYRAANANELPPIGDNNADLFSQNITYSDPATQTGATPQYNGNISSTTWQVLGRDKQAYGYKYDGLDRLTEAKYFDITEQYYAPYTSIYNTIDKKYDETITYDIRGNITSLKRNGLNAGTWTSNGYTAATYGMIDNLVYNYKPNPTTADLTTVTANTSSNKLLNVRDMSLSDKGFKYNISNLAPTYTYDANGNLTSDLNKGIVEIKYNYLNLPILIRLNSLSGYTPTIEFVYDATGVKLKKIVKLTTSTTTIGNDIYDYINGVEYKGGVLQRFSHTEGSVVRQTNGTFMQEYDLRDHLGNTRVTFTDANNDGVVLTSDIKQINHYYPFGLNMEGNWQGGAQGDNKYQYNGKQWNDDFGLNLNDYGARFYDAAMARWIQVDPLSDKYYNHSGYNYVLNNPVLFTDPDGREVDVSALLQTQAGFYQLINTMMDLQSMTGMNLEVTDGKLKEHSSTAGKEDMGKSQGARDFTRALINDKKDDIVLQEKTITTKGVYAITESDHKTVNVDGAKIDNLTKSMSDAGLDKLAYGFGFNFLHEAMHTKSGGNYIKSEDFFDHWQDKTFRMSRIETQLNMYRAQLGLPELVETEPEARSVNGVKDKLRGETRMSWQLNGTTIRVLYQTTGESNPERLKRVMQFNQDYINKQKK